MAWCASALHAQDVDSALATWKAGNRDGALKSLRAEIAKDPASVRPKVLLTELLLASEQFDEADAASSSAIESNPNSSELHRVAGDVKFREGQIVLADAEYKKAFNLDQKSPRAVYGLARAFQTARLNRQANLLIHQANQIDPSDHEIESALEETEGQTASSLERWEKALRALPKSDDSGLSRALTARIAVAKKLGSNQPSEFASAYGHYDLPITYRMDGPLYTGFSLKVSLNGVKDELRVDTGASGFVISNRTAEKAGVPRLADSDIFGTGNKGGRSGWIGLCREDSVRRSDLQKLLVHVTAKASLDTSDGLIGTDVFSRFMIKMNFYNKRVELDPLPGPP